MKGSKTKTKLQWKRTTGIFMAFVMVLSVVGVLPVSAIDVKAETGKTTLEMHFDNAGDWSEVAAYLASGGTWIPLEGYAYAGSWPGALIEKDSKNTGWYSFTIEVAAGTEMKVIFNNNDGGQQTGNIEFTKGTVNEEYWVEFKGHQTEVSMTTTAPAGWVDSTSVAPINPNAGSGLESPVVNSDRTVTITYEDKNGTFDSVDSVNLMGTLKGTDWNTGLAMTKSTETGKTIYSVTTPVQEPGVYGYKIKGGNTWLTDPLNGATIDGNSKVIISGLAGASLDAQRGVATALPETLKYYDSEGNVANKAVSYKVKDAALESSVTIEDGKVTVAKSVSAKSVVLVASIGTEKAEVTVNLTDEIYNYTVYYYDSVEAHMSADAADIHAWEVDGGNIGPIDFTGLETLADGKQWLKATFSTDVTNMGLIPRSKGEWSWQTTDHIFNNELKEENVTIYIVYGDTKTYTELPSISKQRERHVMIEYIRPEADYEGWNLYTWNSGFGSDVTINLTEIGGKQYFIVPVQDSKEDFTLSFCVRRSTADEPWAEKDGGDHAVVIPADQTVVKAVFEQNQSVTSIVDYNTGYVRKAAEDKITFLYRDDESFLVGKLDELSGKVFVVVNDKQYAMKYNAEKERYEYDLTGCKTGEYEYYYLVNGEKKLDAFNSVLSSDGLASVVSYKKVDGLTISAEVYYDKMNYNDNNVVTVKFSKGEVAEEELANATIDLKELGLGKATIDTELMEVTIAAKNTVAAGKKILPVEVTDIYGNIYTCNAEVTLEARDKDAFDWDEAVIYMTILDRFFDGNTANNDGVDKDGTLSYHGGDFAGLEAKLDYLQDLGVNTVWITPIVENSDTTTEMDGEEIESTGYHGYWASDFTKLNSHLGTEKELEALIEAMHERGMKLMVDVVLNHAGYGTEDYFNSIINGKEMIREAENTVTGDDIYSSLSGLPDFVTEDDEVRDQIIEWQVNWMSKFDIDFYRVDTVKHVDNTTWAEFRNELAKVDADFKLIGEHYGAGYGNSFGSLGTGTMDALLDFDINDQVGNFVSGKLESTESFFANRNNVLNNTATYGGFLSSHDEDSFVDSLIAKGMTEDEALALAKVAASLQLTAKGQAVIYYGEEIGQHGLNNYPVQTNRSDFDWTEAKAQASDKNSMLAHYTKLLTIREEYKTLFARADRESIAVSDKDGYDVFKRTYGDESLYVGLNIKKEAQKVTFKVSEKAGTVMKDLYSGASYTVGANGEVTVTIPAANGGGTVILAVGEAQPPQNPSKPEGSVPTGDNTSIIMWTVMMGAAVAMASTVQYKKRQR